MAKTPKKSDAKASASDTTTVDPEMTTSVEDPATTTATTNTTTATTTSTISTPKSSSKKSKKASSSAAAPATNGASTTSSKKTTATSLSKTYLQLVQEAIVALKDFRTGSSLPAIQKYILTHYPDLYGTHFRSRLNLALKSGVAKDVLTKIKSSYKISAAFKAAQQKKKKQAANSKNNSSSANNQKNGTSKKETLVAKVKALEESKTADPAALEKARTELRRQQATAAKQAALEEAAKQRADRLKRRRFPMEDTKLHAEDKELNVKPPTDVTARPHLPYFWNVTLPLTHPTRQGKTGSCILQASKADGLDTASRGVVSDLLQVYHFFRGDVHFGNISEAAADASVVPEFGLQQLLFAVDEMLQGNMKKSRTVPPLIVHLFVVSLQFLCQDNSDSSSSNPTSTDPGDMDVSKAERQFRRELATYLLPALSPVSWPDVLFLYMDAMERYYTTDASRAPAVLAALTTDVPYLLGQTNEAVVPMTPSATMHPEDEALAAPLPEGYHGYLGDPRGALQKAFSKLSRMDPWLLTAEELICLLRALTDDLLAAHPHIAQDIAAREEEMQELLKQKRAADTKYRKVRLAFEGPKKPPKKVVTEDGKPPPEKEEAFKPTATKKQFESAKKAQQKASDAYEKGIRKLVARTEPIGTDRSFNPVYCFRHDPEILYVEELRPPLTTNVNGIPAEMQFPRRSWHIIESASLFDAFVSSLDIRGKREHDLYEEMLGPQGANQSLRRFLVDDVQQEAAAKATIREKDALKKRLESARKKCEQGRRSGRFAGQVEEELVELSEQVEALDAKLAAGASGKDEAPVRDYAELTGLTLLRKFDFGSQKLTRRTREQKANAQTKRMTLMPCSKLCGTGNIDGTGLVGMLVADMLELEELCESLAPWERRDVKRSSWISNVEGAVVAWNNMSPTLLGPDELSPPDSPEAGGTPRNGKRDSMDSAQSKRRRVEGLASPNVPSAYSVPSIISLLRTPLIDLEARVADITNLAVATRDAEIADDNLSTDGSEEDRTNRERREKAWKRIVHRIRETTTRRHVQIRELLVAAIAAARRAHLPEIVSQLRAALLKHHPNAAGECKIATVAVLVAHGDYNPEDDEDAEEGVDLVAPSGTAEENAEDEEILSVLSAEAAVLAGSLDGADDATRVDWIEAVKACKTFSRFGSLTTAFIDSAMKKLKKLDVERDRLLQALSMWEKDEDRKAKARAGRKTQSKKDKESRMTGPSEVWANVSFTNDICMAKAEDYPSWPAKVCNAKDSEISSALERLDRRLVAFVGEMGGLRVVRKDDIQAFKGILDEDLSQVSKDTRTQLEDCMAMARRILRGTAAANNGKQG